MRRTTLVAILLASTALISGRHAWAGQAPFGVTAPEIPVTHSDRVYSADQYSNTVSVTDPADNKLLGTIHLGNESPSSLSPLYTGQLLVHGLGFSPDRRTVDVVSIGSNSVTFIDTATNSVKHISYVGRSPHEAFFTPDGAEVWVTVRGENYVQVLDGTTYQAKTRIIVPRHDDLLARWKIRLCLLVFYARDRRHICRRSPDHRKSRAGEPVLPQHRRHPGRFPGVVHLERYRQDRSL